MSWYLVHTKPRQEARALENLQRQGFSCWLPRLKVERLRQRRLVPVEEPLFPRYLFIELLEDTNWAPVRSTLGVTTIVRFGGVPARVPEEVLAALREEEAARLQDSPRPRFTPGQAVAITEGPFAGVRAVFDMNDGEARAMVLIELLSKPVRVPLPVQSLRALAPELSEP